MNTQTKQKQQTARCSEFIVRIKSGSGVSVQGKIEHIQSGQVQYFNDFLEMLMLVQTKLDEKDYPQCDTELRSFCDVN